MRRRSGEQAAPPAEKDPRLALGYNRVHGVASELRGREAAARRASRAAHGELAASLRGKAVAYREAAQLVEALERDQRIGHRRRWTRR